MLVVSLLLVFWEGVTGFIAFEALDLVLLALAVVTALALLDEAVVLVAALLPGGGALAPALLALVIVLVQLVNVRAIVVGDRGPGRDTGIWLAVAGIVLTRVGQWSPPRASRWRCTCAGANPPMRDPPQAETQRPDAGPEPRPRTWPWSARTTAPHGSRPRPRRWAPSGAGGAAVLVRRARQRDGGGLPRRQGRRRHVAPRPARATTAPPPSSGWTCPSPPAAGAARNTLVLRESYAPVTVAGGYGTLSEVERDLLTRRPVSGLDAWDFPACSASPLPRTRPRGALHSVSR